ncbi:YqjD family protein [Pseudomonas sp. WHRI 8519]|uniref:DUF883 family protein n=1 Tax=Pseudomonas sp. WHRI 8519 TaxID=3162567 RepID=UPI003558870B
MAAILHLSGASSLSRRNFPGAPASIAYPPIDEDMFMARKSAFAANSEQIKDQVFSELQALIEESERLLNDSASLVGEEADTLRAQVSLKLRQAREAAGQVRAKAQPVVDATNEYIGGHPWQTVAVSAGFGLVIGLLLGRRH